VPPRDAEALAKAILDLLEDPGRRRSMGQAASRRIEAQFDISRTARGVEDLYVSLGAAGKETDRRCS